MIFDNLPKDYWPWVHRVPFGLGQASLYSVASWLIEAKAKPAISLGLLGLERNLKYRVARIMAIGWPPCVLSPIESSA